MKSNLTENPPQSILGRMLAFPKKRVVLGLVFRFRLKNCWFIAQSKRLAVVSKKLEAGSGKNNVSNTSHSCSQGFETRSYNSLSFFFSYSSWAAQSASLLEEVSTSDLSLCLFFRVSFLATNLFCQGHDSAPSLNIMLLKRNISASLDRQQIRWGSIMILLLSTCTVAAIPCCSFFPRNWLSGLQINMLLSWMCLQDLTSQDPGLGVLPHSIEFCRPASRLTSTESTFTPSSE